MPHTRTEALTALLDDIAAFDFPLNNYNDYEKLRHDIDNRLTGKLDSLRAYCQLLGWSELVSWIQDMTPINDNAVVCLEVLHTFVIPEARRLLATTNIESPATPTQWFWEFVHPRIRALAQSRFEAGFFGDAVEASFKEINDAVKRLVREATGRELDGADLMWAAFSPKSPILRLTPLETETDRNIQQGYMQIFAGGMIGVRNPQAHGNHDPGSSDALHLICLASLLLRKLDERL
jgi:uncharacterized protein (TIGR02391 family)